MKHTFLFCAFLLLFSPGCQSEEAEQAAEATQAQEEMDPNTAFMNEVAERDGVVTTASGLMYQVIEEGEGEKPTATSTVTVHYEGTFPNGDVFDSSYARGETIAFPLNGVIPGWTEGLQLMSPGAKYKLYLPSELGYGAYGSGPIPPNQPLVFTVELISVD